MKDYITKMDRGILFIVEQPCFLQHNDALYVPPTIEDLKHIRKMYKITQVDVAKITGVSWNSKGSSTVAKWEINPGKADHRQIPYSAWRLLLITLGIIYVEPFKRSK